MTIRFLLFDFYQYKVVLTQKTCLMLISHTTDNHSSFYALIIQLLQLPSVSSHSRHRLEDLPKEWILMKQDSFNAGETKSFENPTWEYIFESSIGFCSARSRKARCVTANVSNKVVVNRSFAPGESSNALSRIKLWHVVRVELDKRGIYLDPARCPVCNDDVETIDHMLIYCNFAEHFRNFLHLQQLHIKREAPMARDNPAKESKEKKWNKTICKERTSIRLWHLRIYSPT